MLKSDEQSLISIFRIGPHSNLKMIHLMYLKRIYFMLFKMLIHIRSKNQRMKIVQQILNTYIQSDENLTYKNAIPQ